MAINKINKKRSRGKKSPARMIIIALVMVVFAFSIVGAFMWINAGNNDPTKDPGKSDPDKTSTSTVSQTENGDVAPSVTDANGRKDGFYNFLVVGRDAASSSTDVIMLVSYDVTNQKVSIMQVPRDSYVESDYNDGYNLKKVNAIFAYSYLKAQKGGEKDVTALTRSGLKGLEETLESTLGTSIDYYVYMDLSIFKSIVDIIGGVEMNVPHDMKYTDEAQNLYINLKAGPQTLDGDKAEQYVRFRHGYVEGDIGRLSAQKIFLTAVANKLLSSVNISTLPQLTKEVYSKVVTNLTLNDILYFAKAASGINTSNITIYTACGESFKSPQSGASYFSLYIIENATIINNSFNCFNKSILASNLGVVEKSYKGTGYKDTKGQTVAESTENPPEIAWMN